MKPIVRDRMDILRFSVRLMIVGFLIPGAIPEAIPSPAVEVEMVVFDDRFYQFIEAGSSLEILAPDLGWAEGPVWVDNLKSLIFLTSLSARYTAGRKIPGWPFI